VGILGATGAASWIGQPFPGFLVLENRVVASVGLSIWPATADGEIYQQQVVQVGDTAVESPHSLHAVVASVPVGTPLEYRFQRGDRTLVRTIATRRFGGADFVLLFGLYLLNGVVMGGAALVALRARKRNASAAAVVPFLMAGSVWGLSALDLYGPYRLFRLHALAEVMLFPATLHMALCFPHPARFLAGRAWLVSLPYALAAGLGIIYQLGLQSVSTYVLTHLAAITAFGAALVVLMVAEMERYRRPRSLDARSRIGILAVGALLACSLPICLSLAELLTGGRSPQNAVALTAFLFPLSIVYAIARDDWIHENTTL
jgi:hypothetical protein